MPLVTGIYQPEAYSHEKTAQIFHLRYFPAELPCYTVPTTFSALHSRKAERFNFGSASDAKYQVNIFVLSVGTE